MGKLFACKVSYDKTLSNGFIKKVTEIYIVEASCYTDAEAKITDITKDLIRGDWSIVGITRAHYTDIIKGNGNRFYYVKLSIITLDANTGNEKKSFERKLVCASSFKEAYDSFIRFMKDTVIDYEIVNMGITPIIDVYYDKSRI